MNFKKINFQSPLIILIIIFILIAITLILLNQNKINLKLTNNDSNLNFTLNTENFQDENISNQLNLVDKKITDLQNKILPLINSSHQFDRIKSKKKYIQDPNYFN